MSQGNPTSAGSEYQPPEFGVESPGQKIPGQKSEKGCFFWGCITVLVLGVLGTIAIGVGLWLAYRASVQAIVDNTSDQPREVPQVEIPEEELADLRSRIQEFQQEAESGKAATLTLTGAEITPYLNSVIDESDEPWLKAYRDTFFITIEDGRIKGDVSLPLDPILDQIPLFGGNENLKGRYFNGKAEFSVTTTEGILMVRLVEFETDQGPMPEEVKEQFAMQNLAEGFYDDPDSRKAMQRLEDVSIEGDTMTIRLKATGATDQGEEGEAGADASLEPSSEDGSSSEEAAPSEDASAETSPSEPSADEGESPEADSGTETEGEGEGEVGNEPGTPMAA